ncbi:thioesterase family protein [Roseateles sp.]|uniref:thioesterase family protein n=1 Tax=Roseateles sp. TaxID=1971397 RepID=UPI0031D681B7
MTDLHSPSTTADASAAPLLPVLPIAVGEHTVHSVFEAEFTTKLCEIFEQLISFNQLLGVKIDALGQSAVRAHLRMRPELIGHFAHNRMHGGVISATLDSMGGLAVMAATGLRHMDEPPMQRLQRFGKLGTIDLRVDYLRPAIGALFFCEAEVMRLGSRVANTRMSFSDEQGRLLATGAAAYIVS